MPILLALRDLQDPASGTVVSNVLTGVDANVPFVLMSLVAAPSTSSSGKNALDREPQSEPNILSQNARSGPIIHSQKRSGPSNSTVLGVGYEETDPNMCILVFLDALTGAHVRAPYSFPGPKLWTLIPVYAWDPDARVLYQLFVRSSDVCVLGVHVDTGAVGECVPLLDVPGNLAMHETVVSC